MRPGGQYSEGMPVTKRIDQSVRDAAMALFVQGVSRKAICERIGVLEPTLGKWAARGDWIGLRDGTQIKVEVRPKPLRDIGEHVRQGIANDLKAQIELLAKKQPKSINELSGRDGRSATLKTIADTASNVFGWNNQDHSRPLVNLQFLSGVSLSALPNSETQIQNSVNPNSEQPLMAIGQSTSSVIDIQCNEVKASAVKE